MNEGDWICSDSNCGNINFARRLSCYKCNKDRPDGGKLSKKKLGVEIGKSAAEKSRGLFNADDWQCSKCANVNWARRQTCNVCNAPKFGEVEARTGYGGGYNERGVVEYRKRESSSDDEYDEFGRRKRKRKANELEKKQKSQVKQDGEEKESEEDEESGDEGDLSKYDLWGSDEDKDESTADKGKSDKSENPKDLPVANEKDKKSPTSDTKSPKKRSRSSSSSSSTSSSSSSSESSRSPKNKYDDFVLNSERESSPRARKSRSRSPRAQPRRKSRDSRSAGETRIADSSRDKERSRERDRRDKRKDRRYSRDGARPPSRPRHR